MQKVHRKINRTIMDRLKERIKDGKCKAGLVFQAAKKGKNQKLNPVVFVCYFHAWGQEMEEKGK